MFAFRAYLVDDTLEAGPELTIMIRKREMTDLAIAIYPGATFRIHGLCHLHNVARQMKFPRSCIGWVPNLIWEDASVTGELQAVVESVIDGDSSPQPLADLALPTSGFGAIVGYKKEYAMLIDAISVFHRITSVL